MLKEADARLGLAAISHIKASLDRLFGKREWIDWEPETITLELGVMMDPLLLDKVRVLEILEQQPDLFFDDMAFMLHATDVINNNVADFDHVPTPASLELAFAITEVKKILTSDGIVPRLPLSFIGTLAYMLREEGYSKPVEPFDFMPETLLEKGQTAADTEAKKKAIDTYIAHMEAQ